MEGLKGLQKSFSSSSLECSPRGDKTSSPSPRRSSSIFGSFGFGGDSNEGAKISRSKTEPKKEKTEGFFTRLKRRITNYEFDWFSSTRLELPPPKKVEEEPPPTLKEMYNTLKSRTPRSIRLQKTMSFRKREERRHYNRQLAKRQPEERLRKSLGLASMSSLLTEEVERKKRKKKKWLISEGKSPIWGKVGDWPKDLRGHVENEFENNLQSCDLPFCEIPPRRYKKRTPLSGESKTITPLSQTPRLLASASSHFMAAWDEEFEPIETGDSDTEENTDSFNLFGFSSEEVDNVLGEVLMDCHSKSFE